MAQLIDSTHPYRVQMACGHIEIRKMRESTAGTPYSPDFAILVKASACCECEPSKASMREQQRQMNAEHALR